MSRKSANQLKKKHVITWVQTQTSKERRMTSVRFSLPFALYRLLWVSPRKNRSKYFVFCPILCTVSLQDVGGYDSPHLLILSLSLLYPSQFRLHKLTSSVTGDFPLALNMSREFHILETLSTHYMSQKFPLSLSKYVPFLFLFFILKAFLLLAYSVHNILSIPLYGSTFLLLQVSFSCVKKLFNIH